MSRLIPRIFLFGVLAILCPLTSLIGQTDQSSSGVKLTDLSFMMGLWQADWNGGLGEEHWSLPSGDNMVGTFRFVKNGKGQFYELMLVEQTPRGPVLRLKHFNAGLIGWEDKTRVYNYPLVECHPGTAIFEREDKKSRLTYRRTSKQTLLVELDESSDGKLHSENFKFRLVE